MYICLSVPLYLRQFRMSGAEIVHACLGPIVGDRKNIRNSPGMGILRMWTFDVDYVTQNNSYVELLVTFTERFVKPAVIPYVCHCHWHCLGPLALFGAIGTALQQFD